MTNNYTMARAAAGLIMVGMLAACASQGDKQAAQPAPVPVVEVAEQVPATQKDALGNYRFLMQDGQGKMTADQFDAWMKANGIRVAKGVPTAAAPASTTN